MPDNKKDSFDFGSILSLFDDIPDIPDSEFSVEGFPEMLEEEIEDVDFDFDIIEIPDEQINIVVEDEDIDINAAEPQDGSED